MNGATLFESEDKDTAIIHASCVAVEGRGVLIVGSSGTGKSSLALQMIALGADLVADDRVELRDGEDQVMADAAPNIRGMIEARGVGLLRASSIGPVSVSYVVDMDQPEPERLPEPVSVRVLRQTVPLLRACGVPNLAAALMQLTKMGRVDPEWPSK
ncbi:HPr kinase/phosphorylase [Ruegeria sp. Ofav3-42]|uniref:HPr kinase/phosphorylase n=1 Tax=Ruegeria sp. Ofav3-42 TaxID=2917759 RepID=UPI001EF505F8|nr:HPr kinase/phosphatase C-terminal domain-containing protein [Ruegeria sp. Ofav3-42]MCG7522073.1 HPr kinase/phosphatase C-terminal domain-containing protein [Ruegeria sp. Ofav3-42]